MVRHRSERRAERGVDADPDDPGRAGQKPGAIDQNSVKRVAVHTTVMEKNIADPTDSRL